MIEKNVFNTLIDVRVYDLNYGNHLGHDSLVSFFHEARVRLFKKMGYTELNIHGLGILVTNLAVNYVNEAFYSDKLSITIGVGVINKASMQLLYSAVNHDTKREIASALTTIVFYDHSKEKVVRIPQEFLSAISFDF